MDSFDVHLMPQAHILCAKDHLVPKFIGQMEDGEPLDGAAQTDASAWHPHRQDIAEKNVRRGGTRASLRPYFNNSRVIDQALKIYGQDVELFYPDDSIDQLIDNNVRTGRRPMRNQPSETTSAST